MTCNTLTALKTPYTGSLHNRCPYLPDGHTICIPVKPGTEHAAPEYPLAHNPLRYKRKEDFQTNISHPYKTATSIAYTQSWYEYHRGLFSYYLYDHFGRPVETGQAKITHIRTGDHDKVRLMTNADIRQHVISLSNRINVMVAIYNDADPFPACSHLPQDHQYDKIATIYYYPCIHAATPRSAEGQYYPSGNWYAADYHYSPNYSITTTVYQCTAQVQEQPIAAEKIEKRNHVSAIAPPLPAAAKPQACLAAPAAHNHNCPIKNLDVETLNDIHSRVFHVLYGHHQSVFPGSFAAGTTMSGTTMLFYYAPHYFIKHGKGSTTLLLYTPQCTTTHHCRGHTPSQNPPNSYCHSPPSSYITA